MLNAKNRLKTFLSDFEKVKTYAGLKLNWF
jgi:hypothetical protein